MAHIERQDEMVLDKDEEEYSFQNRHVFNLSYVDENHLNWSLSVPISRLKHMPLFYRLSLQQFKIGFCSLDISCFCDRRTFMALYSILTNFENTRPGEVNIYHLRNLFGNDRDLIYKVFKTALQIECYHICEIIEVSFPDMEPFFRQLRDQLDKKKFEEEEQFLNGDERRGRGKKRASYMLEFDDDEEETT